MDQASETRLQLRREFAQFIDNDNGEGLYVETIKAMVANEEAEKSGKLRLEVDLEDLRQADTNLHRQVLKDPSETLQAFEDALEEYIKNNYPKALGESQTVHIAITGEFGAHRISPRNLTSEFISKLVNLEGIVTKASLVRPKVVRSVHFCEATKAFTTREYKDVTSNSEIPTTTAYPTKDESGNLLTTEYGLCLYKDHQVVTMQELPETAPPGQLPRSAEVIVEDDLVDSCKPGDRVSVVGVYKAVPPRMAGSASGVFKAVLVANHVRPLVRESGSLKTSPDLIGKLRSLGNNPEVLDILGASLAPSIYGHDIIKKALILLLLGGRERNLINGTHLRGDINCLLVGDPGVAKSQLLRAVMNVSPLAVSTTGRGSSGVGLTAAVTADSETGERRLEAGAMVLADRGVVCIDEFDKMNDIDRVAIHEVMEQQTVTIAKAGIQTQLNARCSVVAAANPLYGNYDHHISVTRNINLPDSLLSRFDLLFIVLDNLTSVQDRAIADHVLGQHRYRPPGDDGSAPLEDKAGSDLEDDRDEQEEHAEDREDEEMYVKYDKNLHGPREAGKHTPLSTAYLKKYIEIAKDACSEIALTAEATEAIGDFYAELRASSESRALPITVRTLETIIRLSTAAAKSRFAKQSEGVQRCDVDVARSILEVVLNGNAASGELEFDGRRRGAKRVNREGEDGEEEGDGASPADEEEEEEAADAAASPFSEMLDAELSDAEEPVADAPPAGDEEMVDAPEAGGASGSGAPTASQVVQVQIYIADFMLLPPQQNVKQISDFMAYLSMKKCRLSQDTVVQALEEISDAGKSAETGLELMYDAANGSIHNI